MTTQAFFARRPWLATLALLFFGLAVGLGLAEILLRLYTTDDNVRATASLDIYAPSQCCGLALKPNLSRATFWNGKKVYIETDGRRVPRGRVVVGKHRSRRSSSAAILTPSATRRMLLTHSPTSQTLTPTAKPSIWE